MHPLYAKADGLSAKVIGAAIEVHQAKGPGLIESIYERCCMHELAICELQAVNQKLVRIRYNDLVFDEAVRFDVLVGDCLPIEVKSVERILPIHKAQLLSYMKLLNIPLGLVMNFHELVPKNGSRAGYFPARTYLNHFVSLVAFCSISHP